jgi:type IV fimbrial biogenesis protein FimT
MTILSRRLGRPYGAHLWLEPANLIRGVTLIELLCTISIVAILSVVAVPQLGQMQRAAARRVAVNDFLHTLFLARYKSILLNDVVSVCRSHDGATCDNKEGNWQDGWIVFQNTDRDQPADRDVNEEIFYRHDRWQGGTITSNRASFSFRPSSQSDVNGTMVFCQLHGTPSDARAIIISHTGRPRISTRDANNQELQCPQD